MAASPEPVEAAASAPAQAAVATARDGAVAQADAALCDRLKAMLRKAKTIITDKDARIKSLSAESWSSGAFGLRTPVRLVACLAATDSGEDEDVLVLSEASPDGRMAAARRHEVASRFSDEWLGHDRGQAESDFDAWAAAAERFVPASAASHGHSSQQDAPLSAPGGPAAPHGEEDASQREQEGDGPGRPADRASIDAAESAEEFRRYRVAAESRLRQLEQELRQARLAAQRPAAALRGSESDTGSDLSDGSSDGESVRRQLEDALIVMLGASSAEQKAVERARKASGGIGEAFASLFG
ncbi:hypothetical protein FNF27_07999 [Cafeteria roenbergensis]|uniref:Uncharacterized protein n=1 Tax=Cafeteria roenbergensis TaxID=33653 RepID=A0A5A8DGU5_CAFRO|nr:hypothetical protein FNF27_07999 [Cafeteria roenbergensis]